MSKEKMERNNEIVNLINKGLDYRSLSKVFDIKFPRVYQINQFYNSQKKKDEQKHCVRCGSKTDLVLDKKIRNICKNCVKVINKL